jgi:hypothetical protein
MSVNGKIRIVPVTQKAAFAFIDSHHRHHKRPVGWKFGIGLTDGVGLVGVAVVGRPVSRVLDDGLTAEVTRCCTLGHANACSMLYAACWRAARAMGYARLITYILDSESGTSLKASGWRVLYKTSGGSWSRPSRRRIDGHPVCRKVLYEAI